MQLSVKKENIDSREGVQCLQIIRTLGTESIHHGKDLASGKSVLIKSFEISQIKDLEKCWQRFEENALRFGSLKFGICVPLYGIERTEHKFFAIYQDIPGDWLSDLVLKRNQNILTNQLKIELLYSLANSLDLLHENEIISGCLVPSNILALTNFKRILILDPGIGRLSGMTIGSASSFVAPYLAPEVILNQGITKTSDIFSLAVIAFEMLSGARPFKGENSNTLFSNIIAGKRLSILDFLSGSNSALDSIFEKALNKNPRLRFENATSFVESLQNALSECGYLQTKPGVIDFKNSKELSEQDGKSNKQSFDIAKNKINKNSNQEVSYKFLLLPLFLISTILGVSFLIWSVGFKDTEFEVDISDETEIYSAIPDLDKNSLQSLEGFSKTDDTAITTPMDTAIQESLSVIRPLLKNELLPTNLNSLSDQNLASLSDKQIITVLSSPTINEVISVKTLNEGIRRGQISNVDFIFTAFKNPYFKVKIAILKAIENEKQTSKFSFQILSLRTDEDPLVRAFAAKTLMKLKDPSLLVKFTEWQAAEKNSQVLTILNEAVKTLKENSVR